MTATATPIDLHQSAGNRYDSFASTPSSPPTPPATQTRELGSHLQTEENNCAITNTTHRHRSRSHRSPHALPSSQSSASSPPSSLSASSASSSATAHYPAGATARHHHHQHHHRPSTHTTHCGISSVNGESPLLQSLPPPFSIKSYGTASEASSDDAGRLSGRSALVAQRPTPFSSATTSRTLEGTANISPRPLEKTPLGKVAQAEVDAATRVNDLIACGGGHADSPTFQDPSNGLASAGADSHIHSGFVLRQDNVPETSRTAPSRLCYDPHSQHPGMSNDGAKERGGGVDGGERGVSPPANPAKAGESGKAAGEARRDQTGALTNANLGASHGHQSGYHQAEGNGGTRNGRGYGSPLPPPPIIAAGPLPSFTEMVLRRIRTTSLLQLLWVLLLVVMLMVGNAFQVIFLNFWIHQFPVKGKKSSCSTGSGSVASSHSTNSNSGSGADGPDRAEALESSYTTFVISAAIFSGFFIVLFIVYWIWRRPSLKFVREGAGWRLLLGIGAVDTLNSGMAIYAAAHTPEVLQALFVSLVPIYSAFFTKWLLKDPRNYANAYVTVSFALIMAGVALASLFSYVATHNHQQADDSGSGAGAFSQASTSPPSSHRPAFLFNLFSTESASAATRDRRLWCLIFFLSVPPTVLLNVWQTKYMIRYTNSDELTAYLLAHEGEAEDAIVRTSVTRSGEVRTEVDDGNDEAEDEEAVSRTHGALHGQPTAATSHSARQRRNDPLENNDVVAPAVPPLLASGSSSSSSRSSGAATSIEHQHRLHVPSSELLLHGEDTTVKLVMLAADTTIQALMAFALMPLDALPWFGGSDSIQEVWENLDGGVDCVLHCPGNLRYCLLYSMGFVLVYIAAAYLNRYSVTLCSMVSQLSGPITALILIAFPTLNMTGDAAPWYVSVFAIILLSCGTVIYVYWDEITGEEKASGEMQLKWAMMEEQAHRHHPVDDGGENGVDALAPDDTAATPHRRSRTRRYRRRRQSSYVVVVDHDPDAPLTPPLNPSASGTTHS